jgi:hypothetical protein
MLKEQSGSKMQEFQTEEVQMKKPSTVKYLLLNSWGQVIRRNTNFKASQKDDDLYIERNVALIAFVLRSSKLSVPRLMVRFLEVLDDVCRKHKLNEQKRGRLCVECANYYMAECSADQQFAINKILMDQETAEEFCTRMKNIIKERALFRLYHDVENIRDENYRMMKMNTVLRGILDLSEKFEESLDFEVYENRLNDLLMSSDPKKLQRLEKKVLEQDVFLDKELEMQVQDFLFQDKHTKMIESKIIKMFSILNIEEANPRRQGLFLIVKQFLLMQIDEHTIKKIILSLSILPKSEFDLLTSEGVNVVLEMGKIDLYMWLLEFKCPEISLLTSSVALEVLEGRPEVYKLLTGKNAVLQVLLKHPKIWDLLLTWENLAVLQFLIKPLALEVMKNNPQMYQVLIEREEVCKVCLKHPEIWKLFLKKDIEVVNLLISHEVLKLLPEYEHIWVMLIGLKNPLHAMQFLVSPIALRALERSPELYEFLIKNNLRLQVLLGNLHIERCELLFSSHYEINKIKSLFSDSAISLLKRKPLIYEQILCANLVAQGSGDILGKEDKEIEKIYGSSLSIECHVISISI